MQHLILARFALCAAVLAPALAGAIGITAVPPATYVAPSVEKAALVQRPFVEGARYAIKLPAPSPEERKALAQANAPAGTAAGSKRAQTKARRLAVGMGRAPDALRASVASADLTWIPVADGRAARIDVTSSGAAAVRVALALAPTHPDITVRFVGSGAREQIFGPYPANKIAEQTASAGAFWSPVLEGETASIEIHAPAGVPVDDLALRIVRVSHLAASPTSLHRMEAKTASDIGLAGSCEVDVACVASPSQPVLNTAKSVAEMLFTKDDGVTYECTGTLVNDAIVSFTPYFFTASHCIDSQYAAATLDTYWFFDAVACNSKAVPAYVVLSGGAMLLGRSEDYDWALLRLRDAPPSGAQFSAWRAEPVATGTTAYVMHHPEGDLKKWSQGLSAGYHTYSDGSTFVQMLWTQGSTEPGSSGAGLFTFQGNGGFYELRGGLFGGSAACTNPAGMDYFSRLDKALPVMRQYLTPNTPNPNGEVAVVEFYNKGLDHYFMSSDAGEINDLDSGVHSGWERTGLRFLAYADPAQAPAGATPVCRFYLDPSVGDSHFYSADPGECAATAARFAGIWTYESTSVFWMLLPDKTTGACPSGTRPVYRFFNTARTNHRYTAEVDIRDDLAAAPGWIAEGYGPDSVIMCSPAD